MVLSKSAITITVLPENWKGTKRKLLSWSQSTCQYFHISFIITLCAQILRAYMSGPAHGKNQPLSFSFSSSNFFFSLSWCLIHSTRYITRSRIWKICKVTNLSEATAWKPCRCMYKAIPFTLNIFQVCFSLRVQLFFKNLQYMFTLWAREISAQWETRLESLLFTPWILSLIHKHYRHVDPYLVVNKEIHMYHCLN